MKKCTKRVVYVQSSREEAPDTQANVLISVFQKSQNLS